MDLCAQISQNLRLLAQKKSLAVDEVAAAGMDVVNAFYELGV